LRKQALVLSITPAGNPGYTFKEMDMQANQYAHFLIKLGIEPKQSVCVMMDNGLDILLVLLSLLKVGAIPAFINTNLSGDSLLHCVEIVSSVAVVFDGKYAPVLSQIKVSMSFCLLNRTS
jgi:acyl-CoA synthetase (AMP-forming)/AMP-acid ligase II